MDTSRYSLPSITITVSIYNGEFFTNVSAPDGSFVCSTSQPTLDMSLASVMPEVRRYAERAASVQAEPAPVEDPLINLPLCYECSDLGITPLGNFCDCETGKQATLAAESAWEEHTRIRNT